jgi:hypothetical protein
MSIVIALALLLAFIRFFHPEDSSVEVRRHHH